MCCRTTTWWLCFVIFAIFFHSPHLKFELLVEGTANDDDILAAEVVFDGDFAFCFFGLLGIESPFS
jgi:hypothetical protein